MKTPLISIIITILNGENTILSCLDSIRNQSFKNFEVVIVDGGSTDNTLDITKQYSLEQLRVYEFPGIGLYAGLNAGIRLATGKWYYFMGCDDKLFNSKTLEEVANIIYSLDKKVSFLVGNVYYGDSGRTFRSMFGSPFLMNYRLHHQGIFYIEDIFKKMKYNEDLRISSDYEVNLKLFISKTPYFSTDLIICNFSHNGISHSQLKLGAEEMQIVHRRNFSGLQRLWITIYFNIRYRFGLFRERHGLTNLKSKFSHMLGLSRRL